MPGHHLSFLPASEGMDIRIAQRIEVAARLADVAFPWLDAPIRRG